MSAALRARVALLEETIRAEIRFYEREALDAEPECVRENYRPDHECCPHCFFNDRADALRKVLENPS
ncbi:MAG TPA: hypothetical protein VFU47_16360 [Armatimonadota bacterium]|nr:hypothetical protein [Armatimonadota bacterium]